MKDIQFSIQEQFKKVAFEELNEFEVNVYYLTKKEAEDLRTHILEIVDRRE